MNEHFSSQTTEGPDYCKACSDAAHEWVQWPCPVAQKDGRVGIAAVEAVLDRWTTMGFRSASIVDLREAFRIAFANSVEALAKHDAEVLRAVALQVPLRFDWTTAEVMAFIRECADRIAGDQ